MYKKTAVTLYYMMIISYGVCDTLFGICYIIILHQKGISILEISALMAISGLVGFLFDFPSGIICDIYGRKKVAGIGFGLWGIGFFLFILGKSYGSFLTAAFVMCSATALISGAPISWFIECYMTICDDRKQIDITIQKGRSYVKWGSMAAAMLGGWLLALNLYIPLYIAALIALTVSIMIQMVGEDNCGERKVNTGRRKLHIFKTDSEIFCKKVGTGRYWHFGSRLFGNVNLGNSFGFAILSCRSIVI